MLVHSIWCNVCLLLLCVLRVRKIFKLCLVERSSLIGTSLSLSTTKFPCFSAQVFIWSFLKSFLYNPNHSFQFLIRQTISINFSGIFLAFSVEHNPIFRCSKQTYHELQILYLGPSCFIISRIIFSKFLEHLKYFSQLKYQF